MNNRLIRVPRIVLAAWLLAVAGCGQSGPDYDGLDLSSVHGTVTLDGEPLAGALVVFEAEDRTFSYALTDGRGNYELMFNSEKRGVTKGNKIVRIWSSRGIPGRGQAGIAGEGEDPDAAPDRPEKVPAKYNEQSELEVTVAISSHKFDFGL